MFEAQTQSMHAMRPGNSAASVDIAARDVITRSGFGQAFTHRVGHGIGIKGKIDKQIGVIKTDLLIVQQLTRVHILTKEILIPL